ncbi:MAG: protein kinase [Anaerolineales bacterium]
MEDPIEIVLSGRYRILNRLGSGGMANVYKARDLNLQRDVAVKILRTDLIEDPNFRARFLQEARSAANLTHPNIVTIYDFGHDSGQFFIIMEYVEGNDLKTVIRSQGQQSVQQAVDLMIQIGQGVGYAHRAGLVHCDLKPQNILVSPDGRVKITDFGISRALASITPEERADVVWGSPKYFSPEQAAGNAPSPASDVYALGIILFELLTGELPFEADTSADLAELHQTAQPPTPRIKNPSISIELELILLKVLSKEPAARYRTADQFARVLMNLDKRPQVRVGADIVEQSNSVPYDFEYEGDSQEMEPTSELDWLAIVLGLIAFLLVGGLIPLWLWVCLRYPSCPI